MTYKVFYRKVTPPFGATPDVVNMSNYRSIANVEADDLEDLFRRMNVVDGSSIEMPQKLRCRSMCVGDLAISPDEKAHYCASAGWQAVEIQN